MTLRKPLTALLISPDKKERQAIIEGKKTMTLREGHRDYSPGPVMLCCHIDPWCVKAEITSVRHCSLGEVTRGEYFQDGYSTPEEMETDLRRYYPQINRQSPVTIITFENINAKS